jgi:hypothetical protein
MPIQSIWSIYAAGRVYATPGPVIDVSIPTAPVRVGEFAFSGAIAPVPAKARAYMASPATAPSDADMKPRAWRLRPRRSALTLVPRR